MMPALHSNRIVTAILAVIVFCGVLPRSADAQIESVRAVLDTNRILIGEQIKLSIEVQYRVDQGEIQLSWPQLKDTLSKEIEIIDQSEVMKSMVDKENDPYLFRELKQYILTSFDSGYHVVKPITIHLNTGDSIVTEAQLLDVQTVEVDQEKGIVDIKEIHLVDYPWHERLTDFLKEHWLKIVLIIIGLIVLILAIIKFTKKKPQEATPPPIPLVPPHIEALENLGKIKEQKLWEKGQVKAYHIAVNNVLRRYIGRRFEIAAMETTSDEILKQFRSSLITKQQKEDLKYVFLLSDLVKFAKEKPLAEENIKLIEKTEKFIKDTLLDEEEENHDEKMSDEK